MKHLVHFCLALALTVMISGCEWESSGDDGSWNDSYSWINFSGVYRGAGGTIVRGFSTGAPAPSPGNGDTGPQMVVVNDEDAGVAPALSTVLTGQLNFRPGIAPLSVTITFFGSLSSGSVTDDGNGNLSGIYNLVGPDGPEVNVATGTINYDTGTWVINLTSDGGLLAPADIRANYTYSAAEATSGGGGEETSSLGLAGGNIYSLLVEQTGNKIRFVDSNGNTYEGSLSVVSLAGGDSTGRSSGDVNATFEVSGTAGGQVITITGSFAGAYLAPGDIQMDDDDSPILYGNLRNRNIQGIWIQPNLTADVYGTAPQISVALQSTAAASSNDDD